MLQTTMQQEDMWRLHIVTPVGLTHDLKVAPSATVSDVKKLLAHSTGLDAEDLALINGTTLLDNHHTMHEAAADDVSLTVVQVSLPGRIGNYVPGRIMTRMLNRKAKENGDVQHEECGAAEDSHEVVEGGDGLWRMETRLRKL